MHQTLIQCIQKFMRNSLHPFIVKDVRQYVYQNMGKYYQYQALYKIMKEEMSLSYNKCKPRPNSINLDEVNMRRVLFWTKFTKALKRGVLIANTDESTIGRDSLISYSWSRKGMHPEFKNQPFVGFVNMILTILSNGAWYWLLTNQMTNSERFSEYICRLDQWMRDNNTFGYEKLILTMDNWSSHRSQKWMKLLKNLNHQVFFNPAYTPQFAPIEMCFHYLKQRLRNRMRYEVLNLSNRFSHNKIFEVFQCFEAKVIKNWFKQFYIELKAWLSNFCS